MRRSVGIGLVVLAVLALGANAFAGGLTVIIHGWQTSLVDEADWIFAMQSAIDARAGGEGQTGTILVTEDISGNLQAATSSWSIDLSTGSRAEAIVAVDWRAVANHTTSTHAAEDVAAVVAPILVQSQGGASPLVEQPIHLIGHSRGGGMVYALAQDLGQQGVDVHHVTPLDPHPLTASDGGTVVDQAISNWENILFSDNYYQATTYPEGESVSGAYNRLWSGSPAMLFGYQGHSMFDAIADHLNARLAYHGTVDLTNTASDGTEVCAGDERGSWFNTYESSGSNTGFYYSLIAGTSDWSSADVPVSGGDQVRDGLTTALGGDGSRTALTWPSTDGWPNVGMVRVEDDAGTPLSPGSQQINVGDSLQVHYWARDVDSNGTITAYFDADRNPYNSNTIATIGTLALGSGESFNNETIAWDTSGLSIGDTGYVYVEASDGTRSRYMYASPNLSIEMVPVELQRFTVE